MVPTKNIASVGFIFNIWLLCKYWFIIHALHENNNVCNFNIFNRNYIIFFDISLITSTIEVIKLWFIFAFYTYMRFHVLIFAWVTKGLKYFTHVNVVYEICIKYPTYKSSVKILLNIFKSFLIFALVTLNIWTVSHNQLILVFGKFPFQWWKVMPFLWLVYLGKLAFRCDLYGTINILE